jgi:hypothetical protein
LVNLRIAAEMPKTATSGVLDMLRCIHRLPKFALLWGGGKYFALRLFGSHIPYGQSSRLIRRQGNDDIEGAEHDA